MVEELMLHVRFEGQSRDIAFHVLDVGDLNPQRLARYVVERHANGNITVRPEAVFG
jgi:hypothetical protein